MARLKQNWTVGGSTIIEVITASVIFLVVFFLAMEMTVRIGMRQPDETLIQAGIDEKSCIQDFMTGPYPSREYLREYEWGEIEIKITSYRGLENVCELQFTTQITKGNRIFVYRVLKRID